MSRREFRKDKPDFSIRRTQLIMPFGVGAIVNMPDVSLMACSIDYWDKDSAGVKVYDERLQKRLRVNHFIAPASSEQYPKGLPFVYFPKWLSCPSCRSFRPISEWKKRWFAKYTNSYDVPRCDNVEKCRNTKLIPARFVVACERGHIDDFPWVEWAHKKRDGGVCNNPELSIHSFGGIAGLGGISIRCDNCNFSETMAQAFSKTAFNSFRDFCCTGFKPWRMKHEACDEIPKTLQRGASNVYFPQIVSSICIPPYSDDLSGKIAKDKIWDLLSSQDGGVSESEMPTFINNLARRLGEPIELVKKVLTRMLKASDTDNVSMQSEIEYRYDEYQAFQGRIKDGKLDSRSFSIEIVNGSEYGIPGLKNIVLAHRLKEIRALVSFSRINPIESDESSFSEDEKSKKVHKMPISENKDINWLPAVEVNGEGIFIQFDEQSVWNWGSNPAIQKRIVTINKRYGDMCASYGRASRTITPEFVFLHTFAHILIRQLSYEAGYSTASMRERIYCNSNAEAFPMSGVLIYTASGDSEGSMGGLVRQGRIDRLPTIIKKAINKASWCSSDPVCIESDGQGLGSVNLAACYACLLLPETTCEENNRFLDRATLVGLPGDYRIGFWHDLV